MIQQLGNWLWVIVFVCSVAVALLLMAVAMKGHLNPNAASLGTLGGGAVVAAIGDLIDGANSGQLVGRGFGSIISDMGGVAIIGAFIGFWAFMAAMGIVILFQKMKAKTE